MLNDRFRVKVPHNLEIKLDLGCGKYKKDGYIGLDAVDFGQEIVWDVAEGIPLPDNSVAEVFSSHFFEHLTEPVINRVVWELKRVCKSGAELTINCPHADTTEAYDIAHYSLWDEQRIKGLFNSTKDEVLEIRRQDNSIFAKVKII
jgi:predicted SAM-dependent methyltransferase